MTIATVLLDDALDRPLDYRISEALLGKIRPGSRVNVPVRGHLRTATVIERKTHSCFEKLSVLEEVEEEGIPQELFPLALWMQDYYAAPFRKIVKSILPPPIRKQMKEKTQLFVSPLVSKNELATLCSERIQKKPAQARALTALLAKPQGLLLSELLEHTSKQAIDTLAKEKWIHLHPVHIDRSTIDSAEYLRVKAKKLSEEQQMALDKINATLDAEVFGVHLLFGVTGSGKTEIYFRAIEKTLESGKGVLFLIPEIALTSQTVERLKARFEERVATLHHKLSDGEKRDNWHAIAKGEITLVIGARSALFAPIPNLGLIIVDEEQDSSYKQSDDMPCYNARDVAIMRAKFKGVAVILGSATPSFESYNNALKGKFALSTLKNRPLNSTLPTVEIVDMKEEIIKNGGFTLFSQKLLNGIKKRKEVGEQTLLFLNRRGYHTARVCESCGESVHCPHCSLSLTYHREQNRLTCHLCGFEESPPSRNCKACGSDNGFAFKGVGTELVEKSIQALLPGLRTMRMDGETTKHKGSQDKLFREFRSGKADLLIGTQMVAKGLHFPLVTLVGVLNADTQLHVPDFRASEYLFQLLTQVAGRAGRADLKGEVVVQTQIPDASAIIHAKNQDFESFYKEEIEHRTLFNFPPMTHLVKVLFSGTEEVKLIEFAHLFHETMAKSLPEGVELLPVLPCGHAKIKDRFRFHFLMKMADTRKGSRLVLKIQEKFQEKNRIPKSVHIHIDVDPLSIYF